MATETEITKAVAALKLSKIAESMLRQHLLVQDKDEVSRKFRRAVVKGDWEGKTLAAVVLGDWIADMMSWKYGTLSHCNSVRELSSVTGLSRSNVEEGLALLTKKGFIKRQAAAGRRTSIEVGDRIRALSVGQCDTEHLSKRFLNIANHLMSNVPASGTSMSSDQGHQCPPIRDGHPSQVASHKASQKQAGEQVGVQATPSPHPTMPAEQQDLGPQDLQSEATTTPHDPQPRDTSKTPAASAGARVEYATDVHTTKVDATQGWGYGVEIEGLNGATTAWVDRFAALQRGIVTNKDPAWFEVQSCVRAHGEARTKAAITRLVKVNAAEPLKAPPSKLLQKWAKEFTIEDAERIIAANPSKEDAEAARLAYNAARERQRLGTATPEDHRLVEERVKADTERRRQKSRQRGVSNLDIFGLGDRPPGNRY